MRRLFLERELSNRHATYGSITVGRVRFCSLELPWRQNRAMESCIPPGLYVLAWEFSHRFQRMLYELKGVPSRSEIKIHPANLPSELNGCIALGRYFGEINGQRGILKSRDAVTHFEQILAGEPFELEVKQASVRQ